jgi:hypothetical protein
MGQQLMFGLGFLVWMLGCGHGPTAPELDEAFTLRPGQAATVEGQGLEVTFDSVAEDSRCPVDVTCVWEGDATVKVSLVQPPREKQAVELHTAGSLPRKVTYGDFEVELRELAPRPRSTSSIPPDEYRATLAVHRAGTAP